MTHLTDSDQRAVELPFAATGGALHVKVPPNGAAAPPGYYMLFVNRKASDGSLIPSVASIVHFG